VLLRLFRPGYVRRMAVKRLGECPRCPHKVLDPRDLKYYRNVCGYYFPEEEDPFTWRDELGFARAGLGEVVLASSVCLLLLAFLLCAVNLIHHSFWAPVPFVALAWFFVLFFFRDPDREVPTDRDALVSPADGTVTHAGEVDEPDFPGGRAFRVSIFLSVFDVHVNRVPRSGHVIGLRYFPGAYLDARNPDCPRRNEQFWIDFEEHNPPRRLRVKQIAGAVARRIVCWLKEGEPVFAGARFGMIKFGSRTEVLIPAGENFEVLVKPGDKVKGGSTVLLRVKEDR
jgi:phosphatidylserine decarboxylase